MRRRNLVALALAATFMPTAVLADGGRISPQDLERRATAIRPSASELRWQQIPWLASLAAARDIAKAEQRPIFVWTVDEDPYDRC